MKARTSTTCSSRSSSLKPPLPFPLLDGRRPAPTSACHKGATALAPRSATPHAVAVVGGLAAERHHASRPQHAKELAERGVEVGEVVKDRGPKTRSKESSSKGSSAASQAAVSTESPSLLPSAEPLEYACERQATASPITPPPSRLSVGHPAGADLERPLVAPRLLSERLAELAGDLRLADLVVFDAPLRVECSAAMSFSGRSRP